MSIHADRYNDLPFETRTICSALMIENEIRLVEIEKKRMLSEYRKAIRAHNERIKRMRQHLRAFE